MKEQIANRKVEEINVYQGSVAAELIGNHNYVLVGVSGEKMKRTDPVLFLVDTGSTSTILSTEAAEKLGIYDLNLSRYPRKQHGGVLSEWRFETRRIPVMLGLVTDETELIMVPTEIDIASHDQKVRTSILGQNVLKNFDFSKSPQNDLMLKPIHPFKGYSGIREIRSVYDKLRTRYFA